MKDAIKQKFNRPSITAPVLVLVVLIGLQMSRIAVKNVSSDTNIFVTMGVIQLCVLALPCILYYLLKAKKLATPVMLISTKGGKLLFLIFAAVFFVSGMLLIKYFYYITGGGTATLVSIYGDFSGSVGEYSHLEIALALIVIPAVCEEFLFRGVIMSEYGVYGSTNAIIVSAICFAMLHFSPENMFVYLFSGLLFGFVTAVTRSIIPSTVLHIMSNFLAIYGSDVFLRVTVKKSGEFFMGFVLIAIVGIAFVLMLSRVESICYDYAVSPPVTSVPPKSADNWPRVFFSPAFLLLIAVFICFTLLV